MCQTGSIRPPSSSVTRATTGPAACPSGVAWTGFESLPGSCSTAAIDATAYQAGTDRSPVVSQYHGPGPAITSRPPWSTACHGPSRSGARCTTYPIAPSTSSQRSVTCPAPGSASTCAGGGNAPTSTVEASLRRPTRCSQSRRASPTRGELLLADQRRDRSERRRDVRPLAIVRELVRDRQHDHPLVEREVVARHLPRLHVDGVVEPTGPVRLRERRAQLLEVRKRGVAGEPQREERCVRRDDALPPRLLRLRRPTVVEPVIGDGPLLVGRVAAAELVPGVHPERVDAVLAVAAGGVVRGREAPEAVLRLLQPVLDLRPDVQRVVDAPALRRPLLLRDEQRHHQ